MKNPRIAVALACTLLFALPGITQTSAQDSGYWRASSDNAKHITGDISFSALKLAINFSAFTIAQIRTLTPAEATALFNLDNSTGTGNLYRLDIPASKRFLHRNTLCGSEDTQWAVTYVEGRTLQLAFFSDASMPAFTPEALANPTTLCGVFTYIR